ncbi:MAG TPA: hypothetical protein PK129_18070, partial [Cellvibrionaceae bacterium]|nr:hypothetical protein [Cellvibrionaceae bacterium]
MDYRTSYFGARENSENNSKEREKKPRMLKKIGGVWFLQKYAKTPKYPQKYTLTGNKKPQLFPVEVCFLV